jgi:hypothetical protein
LSPGAQRLFGLESFLTVQEAVEDVPGVWLVLFRQEVEEYQAQGIEPHPVVGVLTESFTLVGELTYGDVLVQHYARSGG